ncbi:ArsR/SmtB family transcription factor [Halegenticoccus tardaugens]|uniref:ArsR/SmtB family transcription factor n=1 Tax=Halegenticoccus tardaugens TaxID=2071624 RepID=UPI00100B9FE9|nr:winged helix-turn-helix domain-containing protein [Halegenticoccus tardaugens]
MAGLLPSSPDASDAGSGEPRVVGVDSDAADDLLAALSSRTARRALAELHEEPASPAALAERVDTSLQNVQYHLEKLTDAGLVEVADTVYSEKGREMNVYAPADRALVVVAGREEETTGLKATLSRLLGGVGVLGLASLLVDRLLGGPTADATGPIPSFGSRTSAGGDGGDPQLGPDGGGGPATADETTGSDRTTARDDAATDEGAADDADAADASATAGDASETEEAVTATTTDGGTADGGTADGGALSDGGASTDASGGGTPTPEPAESADAVTGLFDADPSAVADALAASPGLLFFLGGLTVVILLFVAFRRRAAGK